MKKAFAVLALWIPLFFAGMALHESLHAAAVLLLGAKPVLLIRPWSLVLAPVTIPGIHVQPIPAFDATRQALDNLMGPGIAGAIFAVAAARLPQGSLRRAAIATALSLAFYAIIETADVVLDGRLDAGFLTAPEFNYGVPVLLAVIVAISAARAPEPRTTPFGRFRGRLTDLAGEDADDLVRELRGTSFGSSG